MHLDKKGGWPIQVVLGLILVLIVGGILIYFIAGSYQEWMLSVFSGERAEREICKKSVTLSAQRLKVGNFPVADPLIDTKCKTLPLEITDKDPEKIKEILANHLYWTWLDFGEGLRDLTKLTLSSEVICKPRYAPISFSNQIEIKNFIDYLGKHNPKGKGQSYLDMMSMEESTNDLPNTIDTSKDYYMVFVIYNKGFFTKLGLTILSGEGYSASVVLIPAEEFSKLGCEF